MRRTGFALLLACAVTLARAATLTPAQALAQLQRTGTLANVEVAGDLDLTDFRPAAGIEELQLDEVVLRGILLVRRRGPSVPLHLRGGSVGQIKASDSRWRAAVVLVGLVVREVANLDRARFDAASTWQNVRFVGAASFVGTRFGAEAEFMDCRFERRGERSSPTFREAVFRGPARFDRSASNEGIAFDRARFETDASFIGLQVTREASWLNVVFGGDAEFRLARGGSASFGSANRMTVFQKLADFRGAKFGRLALGFTDFRGPLLLRWAEVGPAIEHADPDVETWAALEAALSAQGRLQEALQVSALKSRRELGDAMARARGPERWLRQAEDLLWGRLAGYGTRPDRALATLAAVLCVAALPLVLHRGPLLVGDGAPARVRLLLQVAFGRPKFGQELVARLPRWWTPWRWTTRALGLAALALVTLTLARVSPALQALMKAVAG